MQVRRSFLQELEVHNNWSVVDMLFREFYTGSDRDLAADERAALEKGRNGNKLETERERRERERVSDPLLVERIECWSSRMSSAAPIFHCIYPYTLYTG